jgi:hypothetical protein
MDLHSSPQAARQSLGEKQLTVNGQRIIIVMKGVTMGLYCKCGNHIYQNNGHPLVHLGEEVCLQCNMAAIEERREFEMQAVQQAVLDNIEKRRIKKERRDR